MWMIVLVNSKLYWHVRIDTDRFASCDSTESSFVDIDFLGASWAGSKGSLSGSFDSPASRDWMELETRLISSKAAV